MLWQDADDPPAAYEAAGRGAPVLFLQGRFADGSLWAPVAEVLSGRYRTVRVRLQQAASRGANARPAEAVMALMDRLGFPSAHLISHGTRWSTIAEVAVRHPSRARSLTLVYPIVPRTDLSPSVQENWHLEMLLQWLSVGHGSMVRRPEHVAVLRSVIAEQTHAHMGAEAQLHHAVPVAEGAGDLTPLLSAIMCRVQVLVGDGQTAESKALVASAIKKMRQATLSPVPGACRHSPVEAPDTVARLIGEFLAGSD